MSFYKGAAEVGSVHIGSTAADAVYLGSEKVWPVIKFALVVPPDGPAAEAPLKHESAIIGPTFAGASGGNVVIGPLGGAGELVTFDGDGNILHRISHAPLYGMVVTDTHLYTGERRASYIRTNDGNTYPDIATFPVLAGKLFGVWGTQVLSGAALNNLKLYSTADGSVARTVTGLTDTNVVLGGAVVGNKTYVCYQNNTGDPPPIVVVDNPTGHARKLSLPGTAWFSSQYQLQVAVDGTTLYFCSGKADVVEFDTVTETVTHIYTGSINCMGVAVSKTKLYCSEYSLNRVSVFDKKTRALIKTIPVGAGPCHLAAVGNKLFVACRGDNSVHIIG